MHTILSYPDGRYVEALLLSATKDLLRVIIPGGRDASEFKLIKGHWTSEKGVRVEVGALLTDETTDLGQFPSRHATALPRSSAACARSSRSATSSTRRSCSTTRRLRRSTATGWLKSRKRPAFR